MELKKVYINIYDSACNIKILLKKNIDKITLSVILKDREWLILIPY